jgi:hypothetical protein
MTHRPWQPGVYVLGLLLVAGVIALLGHDGGGPARAEQTAPSSATLPNIVGSWAGTWKDTIYMGLEEEYFMTWQITQVREEYCATGIIDFSYFFGMGPTVGSAAGTVTGALRADTLHFTFEAGGLGGGSGTVTGGVGTGSGTNILVFPIDFTFQGTVTETLIRGTFDFPDPGGSGWARMGKVQTPVERASWGEIKARYRDDE